MIEIPVTCSFEEYEEANEFVQVHTTFAKRWNYYTLMFIGPPLALILLAVAIVSWRSDHRWSGPIAPLLCACFLIWGRLRWRPRLRKIYRQQSGRLSGRLVMSAEGFEYFRDDAKAETKLRWEVFAKRAEIPHAFLLLSEPSGFFRVPKVRLSTAEQEQIRGWLAVLPAVR